MNKEKYRVSEVFRAPGDVQLVMPGTDPEASRQEYDQPELLYVLRDGLGTVVLAHIRDQEYHKKRSEITDEVLKENGYANAQELGEAFLRKEIGVSQFLALRRKIQERLKERGF